MSPPEYSTHTALVGHWNAVVNVNGPETELESVPQSACT